MQVATPAPPNLLLRGIRAAPAGAGPQGEDVEEVATLVLKQRVDGGGTVQDAEPLLEDELYDPPHPDPDRDRLRLESDLPVIKPRLDVVVIGATGLDQQLFGTAEIRRTGAPDLPLANLAHGWHARVDDPRKGRAGDTEHYVPDPAMARLPAGFVNRFFNGGRQTGPVLLEPGDEVSFVEDGTGTTWTVSIPAAPALRVTRDGGVLSPPVAPVAAVDTVVLDRTANEVLLTWRAVIPWETRLQLATLEIS